MQGAMEKLTLSEEQARSYCEIMDYIFNRDSRAYVLSGVAGTGKTTLIGMLLHRLQYQCKLNIYCVSFTGRAASVLHTMAQERFGVAAPCSTIHSFLYMSRRNPVTDKIEFILKDKSEIKTYTDVIFVDEAQMVNRELFEDIMQLDLPVVFFGDKEQLPPVSDDDSAFNIMDAADFHMTTIQRQAETNPIIALSREIRETGRINKSQASEEVKFIKTSDVTVDFMKDSRADVILTGTNKERKKYNGVARFAKGFTASFAIPGETIVCLSNSESTEGDYVANGERYQVMSVSDMKTVWKKNTPIAYRFYVLLRSDGQRTSDRCISVNIPESCWDEDVPGHLHMEPTINNIRMSIFTFGYAMSVWKACGSEFDEVLFVDEDVSFFVPRKKFRYTAITRAKKSITIAQGKS